MAAKPSNVHKDKLALYEKLVATLPEVQRKGDANPYTSVNGHMFSILTSTGIVAIRLPSPEREAFLERFSSVLLEQYGVVQKEYVVVPDSLLGKTRDLAQYFNSSFDYVRALKPKPTTRKTTAKPAPKRKKPR